MKWSRRPSCSFLTSLAAISTTTQSASTKSVSAFCDRRGHRVVSFATKTSTSESEPPPPRLVIPSPYFTYTLGTTSTGTSSDTLYVPFTSFCNARTLPQIRGPNFRLPPNVVAALCRVRDEEIASTRGEIKCGDDDTATAKAKYQKKYAFWCQWLDTQESYQMLPPPLPESLTPPPSNAISDDDIAATDAIVHRPTVEELIVEVQQWYDYNTRIDTSNASSPTTKTIVIAGEGEPTLRLYDLMQFIHQLHSFIALRSSSMDYSSGTDSSLANTGTSDPPNVQLRIMTNGLLTPQQTLEFLQCCTSVASIVPPLPIILSVILASSDPQEYNDIMQPYPASVYNNDEPTPTPPFEMVQQFIRSVADVISKRTMEQDMNAPLLLSLEVTAIDRPDVKKEALTKFIKTLGVLTPIRWRPYFP